MPVPVIYEDDEEIEVRIRLFIFIYLAKSSRKGDTGLKRQFTKN